MKKISILLALMSIQAFAADWKVLQKEEQFFLSDGSKEYAIVNDAGTPQFIREEKLNKNYKAVIYNAGEVGTSKIIVIERALLFKNGKLQGLVPFKYYPKGNKEAKLGPKWTVSEKEVVIYDEGTEENWKF